MRIKVQTCGIWHSDSLVKKGHWPSLQFPRAPGHVRGFQLGTKRTRSAVKSTQSNIRYWGISLTSSFPKSSGG